MGGSRRDEDEAVLCEGGGGVKHTGTLHLVENGVLLRLGQAIRLHTGKIEIRRCEVPTVSTDELLL